ncbi:hypothetical protein [Granulicella sp. S190]|uniref:hypothetical protein n=1 Tax=Granulicella sp. S190 TaxID=1747226 RepID=UPI00131E7390|nr:hypothetical protein [Granulicella sp. S190]
MTIVWKWITRRCMIGALLSLTPLTLAAQTMVPWLTRSVDNSRSGWNQHETLLTQASVASKGIRRLTIIPVTGDARGMEAQPLILPGVKVADGTTHDLMVLPSMANVVRGVDAHSGAGLWSVSLGAPINGNTPTGPRKIKPDGCVGDFPTIDCHAINDKWGVLSTGVIDAETQRLYLVAWVSPDGTPQNAKHFVFVLNAADGTRVIPPVLVSGSSGTQSYSSAMRKQRSSLVLTNVNGRKTVFWASGTVQETGQGAAGWVFAFDCATNSITTQLALTQGEGAGIWMGGQGLAADEQGFLYAITGNGDFDGTSQFGESFVKIKYTPTSRQTPATLVVVDHWTPWVDLVRSGQAKKPAMKISGVSAPSEALKPVGGGMNMSLKKAARVTNVNERGEKVVLVFPKMATGNWSDEDWGSAGPACIFAIGVCVAAGKDGIGYPIKTANLGGTTVVDLADAKSNCAKLAAPPVWLTMSPGPVDPCPANPQTLNFLPNGDTAHLHMTPVQFFDPVMKSWTIFVWGENSQLHKWAVSQTGALTYVAQGNEFASANVRGNNPGGMPGGFCSGSSNGTDPDSAILVCTISYGDANAQVGNGRLLVYDAVHLAADKSLKVLWDSQNENIQFLFNKFDPPVIDGGQIYVPNYNGGVDVYELAM